MVTSAPSETTGGPFGRHTRGLGPLDRVFRGPSAARYCLCGFVHRCFRHMERLGTRACHCQRTLSYLFWQMGLTNSHNWHSSWTYVQPNHPLHHLPCLLHAFGPSIMTLFRFVLARRRVLIYTRVPVSPSRSASFNSLASRLSESTRPDDGSRGNSIDQTAAEVGAAPVVEPACVLARVAADICFGWRSEMDVPGLASAAEGAIPVLGMVGLDSIEKLGEETMKKTGWIACALFDLLCWTCCVA